MKWNASNPSFYLPDRKSLVFTEPNAGKKLSYTGIYNAYKSVLKSLGMKSAYTFYLYRSFYVNERLKEGVEIFTATKQTGHSMAICNQYYARLNIQSRADEAIGNREKQTKVNYFDSWVSSRLIAAILFIILSIHTSFYSFSVSCSNSTPLRRSSRGLWVLTCTCLFLLSESIGKTFPSNTAPSVSSSSASGEPRVCFPCCLRRSGKRSGHQGEVGSKSTRTTLNHMVLQHYAHMGCGTLLKQPPLVVEVVKQNLSPYLPQHRDQLHVSSMCPAALFTSRMRRSR